MFRSHQQIFLFSCHDFWWFLHDSKSAHNVAITRNFVIITQWKIQKIKILYIGSSLDSLGFFGAIFDGLYNYDGNYEYMDERTAAVNISTASSSNTSSGRNFHIPVQYGNEPIGNFSIEWFNCHLLAIFGTYYEL